MKAFGVVVLMAACSASTARQSLTASPDGGQVSLDSGGVPDAVILDYGGPDRIVLDSAAFDRAVPSLDSRGPDVVSLDSIARSERPTVEVMTTDGEAIDGAAADSTPAAFDAGAAALDSGPCGARQILVNGTCQSCGGVGMRCCTSGDKCNANSQAICLNDSQCFRCGDLGIMCCDGNQCANGAKCTGGLCNNG